MRISKNLAAWLSYVPIAGGVALGISLCFGVQSLASTGNNWGQATPGHFFDFQGFHCTNDSDGANGCTPVANATRASFQTMNACMTYSREWVADRNDAALKGGCFEKLGT